MTRAQSRLILTGAARRRVFGEYQRTQPSRFVDEIPSHLVEVVTAEPWAVSSRSFSSEPRFGAGPRKPRDRFHEAEPPAYAYEEEDQSVPVVHPGTRVRHPHFGVGTVLRSEAMENDLKLTVRFLSVGEKKVMARFAKLELA
jgi:DNA helicase-2/ATP-dependent DNA helicase PcrA